jgi:acetyl esterase/lipase
MSTILTVFSIIFALFILLALFNPLLIMNGLAFSTRVKRYKDLSYDEGERHSLDVYVPDFVDAAKPVIVFVYGGAWDSGDKDNYKFAGVEFAKLGYVTALPNYRLYPDAKFPHFIEDVANACAALPDQLSKLNILKAGVQSKPLDVIFIGHSAGAHTIAMLNTEPKYLQSANANIDINACIGLAGPYDLPLDDPLVVGKFDGVELHDISEQQDDEGHQHNSHDANPINLATSDMSKMLLMHGRADVTVGLYHSERLSKRLDELGVEHEMVIYEKVPHRHIVGGISGPFQFLNPVFKDITEYLKRLEDKSSG